AVNLTGIAVADIARGDVLARAAPELRPTYLIDAQLRFDEPDPAHHERVQIHHGTREAPARLAWLGGSFWQIRLEQQLVPAAADHLVVRQIAPPDTLGGGVVLDPHPRKHGPGRDALVRLERLARGEPPEPPREAESSALRPRRRAVAAPPRPEPLSPSALATEQRLREAGFEPPLDSELDPGDLAALRAAGRAIRVSKNLHYHPEAIGEVRRRVIAAAERHGGAVTLAQVRDELSTSRKFAQALLEHLDASKVTIRRGDEHVVRAAGTRPVPGAPAGYARGVD
ncbi:MAG: SelB C-terminal domain-containing protein, partial [Solirubrobacterales bacterium]|nr:SelB C-terminal domain-containing protein [Solirubrobacterales bacterium]